LKLLVAMASLAATWIVLLSFSHGEAVALRKSLSAFPETVGEWQGKERSTIGERELRELKLNDYLVRRFENPARASLWLYVGYWETQKRGAQIHSPKHCLPGGGWEPLTATRIPLTVAGRSTPLEVNRFVLQREAAQMVAVYWYESQGMATPSEFEAKWFLVRNSLLHRRSDGALVRLTALVPHSAAETEARLLQFAATMYPSLREFLP